MSDEENFLSEEEIEEIRENDEAVEGGYGEEDTENQQSATDADQKQEVKVKRVRNPQPKLNTARLKGPRGIQTLEGLFDKVKFKGRGHEEDDLKTLLRGYQYWCHRLFPKFRFEDCIEKIERLGTKKDLQTHIKKIRMNMELFDEVNEIVNDPDEMEVENDPFNSLLTTEPVATSVDTQDDELSEEQLARIRSNRERALKRRQELMQQKDAQAKLTQVDIDTSEVASVELPDDEHPTTSEVFTDTSNFMSQEQISQIVDNDGMD